MLASIGAAAGSYLEATLSGDDRIGISSWSQTLLAMVDRMRPFTAARRDRGRTAPRRHRRARSAEPGAPPRSASCASMLGAEPVYVQAPGVVADRAIRDSLLHDGALDAK